MRTIEKTIYKFDELTDKAKDKARQWYRDGAFDYEWWDAVYDDAERIAAILGIEFDRKHGNKAPSIYFSGFWSQGDGASFEGRYSYAKQCAKKIRAYAPQDDKLHRIADDLMEIQKRYGYQLYAEIVTRGHYSHSHSMSVTVNSDKMEVSRDDDEAVTQLMRDFADWIYRTLELEHEYLNADEQVDKMIIGNEYEFDEEGRRV